MSDSRCYIGGVPRLVFHCLLAWTLMLNGIGSAVAATTMHLDSPQASDSARMSVETHGHGHLAGETGSLPATPDALPAGAHADAHGDACTNACHDDQGSCLSVCLQPFQALSPMVALLPSDMGPAAVATALKPPHPAPPPGENIRPPIA